jgi:4'-phosphopantetheinyl transferase
MLAWKKTCPQNDLREGEVHLWRVGLDVDDHLLRRFRETLSEEELRRSEAFRFAALRRRFVGGRGALRAILAGYLSTKPGHLTFAYTAHGKPFSPDPDGRVGFNVSHCGNLMVAAFCLGSPVGVDIEKEESRFRALDIAERFFCDREKREIARQSGEIARTRTFLQIWTAKEAVLKASSLGLALELSKVEIGLSPLRIIALADEAQVHWATWHLFGFQPNQHYWGTLAVTRHSSQIHYRDFAVPS